MSVDDLANSFAKLAVNKGIGAGGSNTNKLGKKFEDLTSNEERLICLGFVKEKLNKGKFSYCLRKDDIVYVTQNGLKVYMKKEYNISLFRCPDEAYIIKKDGKTKIIIVEKKEQSKEGSVETKLWASPSLKREYELKLGEKFKVEYKLCLSNYFGKLYNLLRLIAGAKSMFYSLKS